MRLGKAFSRMFTMPGSGYRPPPDNTLELERLQQAEREANRAREEQRAAQEAAQRREQFTTSLNNAATSFRDRANSRLQRMGLEAPNWSWLVEDAITNTKGRISDLDPNPGQYFTDGALDDAIGRYQTDRRSNFTRQVNDAFRPNEGFDFFSDTSDDPFVDAILGRQRGEAVSALDMARRRGNLDERGHSAAMARLDEMERAGRSTANTISGSVLQGYRDRVGEIGNEARTRAGGYTIGGNFDLGGFTTRRDNLVTDLRGRLEGDVTGALSGQQFFDLGDILTRGGAEQGAVNPRTDLLDVLAERERTRTSNRGVGTGTGTF